MNTLRRPRKRPRVSSVSFRTLGWLLPREAYLRILEHPARTATMEVSLRRWLLSCSTAFIRARVARTLRYHPDWRLRP